MKSSVLILATLVLAMKTTIAANAECNLRCMQNAPCVEGAAPFNTIHPMDIPGVTVDIDNAPSSHHCACPHGWTGLLCDVKFEACDGEHPCYNGGRCIPNLLDRYGNEQLFCDCSTAVDPITKERYVGKYCEHQAIDYCDGEDVSDKSSSTLFCVNGGTCNPEYPQRAPLCQCDPLHDGPHCEFKKGTVPDCTLDCGIGHCTLGIQSSADVHDVGHLMQTADTTKLMHCVCPPGRGGEQCEVKTEACGTHHCYHGATCLTKELDGKLYHHCDCSTAHTPTTSYAGRFCQYQATAHCSTDPNQVGPDTDRIFCVNGGTCSDNPLEDCTCFEPYYGPSCEFMRNPEGTTTNPVDLPMDDGNDGDDTDPPPTNNNPELPVDEEPDDDPTDDPNLPPPGGDFPVDPVEPDQDADGDGVADYAECNLVCENGGNCRRGVKTHGNLAPIVNESAQFMVTSMNFEHCICPKGFVGLRCEHEVEVCDNGEHLCLHGGKCVKFGDEDQCDCSTASIEGHSNTVGGLHCEHAATDICTVGVLGIAQPRSFCVNQGTCKKKITPGEEHPGCDCATDWTGPHCELKVGSAAAAAATPPIVPTSSGKSGGQIFVVLIAVCAVVAAFAIAFCQVRKYRRRAEALELDQISLQPNRAAYSDDPKLMMMKAGHSATSSSSLGSQYRDDPRESSHQPYGREQPNFAAGESEMARLSSSTAEAPDPVPPVPAPPQVYIGPPRDEDGHELHNVEII